MPLTSNDFHDLLGSDLWVIEQILTLPSDLEPTTTCAGNRIKVELKDRFSMPDMRAAVADYRARLLPVIFVVSQKVYAEFFRLVLGNCGISVGNRQVDVEKKLRSVVSQRSMTKAKLRPFSDMGHFQDWWSGTYDYKKFRCARNQMAHNCYRFSNQRLIVKDKNGSALLIDWTEPEVIGFAKQVLKLSKKV